MNLRTAECLRKGWSKYLTIGRKYYVHGETEENYRVRNNHGLVCEYPKDWFKLEA